MSADTNKGSSYIQTVIALFIFVSVFLAIAGFYSVYIKSEQAYKNIQEGTYYLETIKNQVLGNCEYSSLEKLAGITKYINVSENNISHDDIFNNNFFIYSEDMYIGSKYISVTIDRLDNGALKCGLKYFYQGGSMDCVFYKGNYKKA